MSHNDSALAMLSPQDRAAVASMSRAALEENFVRGQLAAQAFAGEASKLRLVIAHLLAKHHRGLLGPDGKPVELAATVRFADTVAVLPSEFPSVPVTWLDANGAPIPPGVNAVSHGAAIRVEAAPTAEAAAPAAKVIV